LLDSLLQESPDTMWSLLPILLLGLSAVSGDEGACYSHLNENCDAPGSDWTSGTCSSVFGGFKGNSNNLHRIIVDDFTDSMTYLLMASNFNTDVVNRMGFSKFFMDKSDKMWARGKDMMKYVLKRGGKMGTGFQIPPAGESNQIVGNRDFSNEMKALGVGLDLMKVRASDVFTAYKHSLTSKKQGDTAPLDTSFDPETAHMLEELSEEYVEDIHDLATKLNTLGKMVKKENQNAMALHLFDRSLM